MGTEQNSSTQLVWESAGTDEPGDQVADSERQIPEGCTSATYEIGPDADGYWSAELIGRRNGEEHILVEFGTPDNMGLFPSEEAAKAIAQQYEDGDYSLPPTCALTGEPGENADDCTTHNHE